MNYFHTLLLSSLFLLIQMILVNTHIFLRQRIKKKENALFGIFSFILLSTVNLLQSLSLVIFLHRLKEETRCMHIGHLQVCIIMEHKSALSNEAKYTTYSTRMEVAHSVTAGYLL